MLIDNVEVPVKYGIIVTASNKRLDSQKKLEVGFFLFDPAFVTKLEDSLKKRIFKLETSFLERYFGGGEEFLNWLTSLVEGLIIDAEAIKLLNYNFEAKMKILVRENVVNSVDDLISLLL